MTGPLSRQIRKLPDLIWMIVIIWLGFLPRVAGLGEQSLWFGEALGWLVALRPLAITWVRRRVS